MCSYMRLGILLKHTAVRMSLAMFYKCTAAAPQQSVTVSCDSTGNDFTSDYT